MTEHETGLTRKESLLRFAGAAALVGIGGAWRLATAKAAGSDTDAVSQGLVKCVLTPELTEGPYYVTGEKLRRDITEGKPGAPLLLNLEVLNARTCKAIKNATVEIWHCDAGGVYSGAVATTPVRTSCAAARRRTRTASARSRRSTPAGTRAGPFTST